jgi:hypothetical protein
MSDCLESVVGRLQIAFGAVSVALFLGYASEKIENLVYFPSYILGVNMMHSGRNRLKRTEDISEDIARLDFYR